MGIVGPPPSLRQDQPRLLFWGKETQSSAFEKQLMPPLLSVRKGSAVALTRAFSLCALPTFLTGPRNI